MPASVAARLAGVRADSSFFYYLDGLDGVNEDGNLPYGRALERLINCETIATF